MISVRLSGRLSGRVQNLTLDFSTVPSQIKLGMSITTVELYTDIPLFVIFDLYLGHKVSICAKSATFRLRETMV